MMKISSFYSALVYSLEKETNKQNKKDKKWMLELEIIFLDFKVHEKFNKFHSGSRKLLSKFIFVVGWNIFAEPYFWTLTFSNILYRYEPSHIKKDAQAVSHSSLQCFEKRWVVGLQQHINLKKLRVPVRTSYL